MAVTDYDFNLTRTQIVKASMRKCGVLPANQTPTDAQMAEAVIALNSMVKSWQNRGVFLWVEEWLKIDLVADQAEYVLEDTFTDKNIFNIRQAYIRDTDGITDTEVQIIDTEEYGSIANKTITGKPWNLVFDRTLTPSVTLQPIPSTSDYDLYLLTESKLKDADSASGNLDFPTNWLDALTYGLAVDLADEYGLALGERQWLASRFEREFTLAKAKSNSQRETTTHLKPCY